MAEQRWLGGIKSMLARAETSHQPRPETGETVVQIPNGLEKLAKAIRSLQSELVEAQAERASYEDAWRLCQSEVAQAFSKNSLRQRDAAHRLKRLQEEWRSVSQDLGLRAEVVPVPIDESVPFERMLPPPEGNDE
jgi:chromosome segregation ATPase